MFLRLDKCYNIGWMGLARGRVAHCMQYYKSPQSIAFLYGLCRERERFTTSTQPAMAYGDKAVLTSNIKAETAFWYQSMNVSRPSLHGIVRINRELCKAQLQAIKPRASQRSAAHYPWQCQVGTIGAKGTPTSISRHTWPPNPCRTAM